MLHDCTEGICGSCETKVIEGEVDHRDYVLTDREKAAGDCMMVCVSRACGQAAGARAVARPRRKPVSADALFGLASSLVDIRALDDTALADDALMREFYDLNRRAELHGRPRRAVLGVPGVPRRVPVAGQRRAAGVVRGVRRGPDGRQRRAVVVPARQHREGLLHGQRRRARAASRRRPGAGRAASSRSPGRRPDDDAGGLHLPFDDREDHAYRGSPRRAASSSPTTR